MNEALIAKLMGGYSKAELEAAFAKVANSENWKMPIVAELPSITSAVEKAKIAYAVEFFTGSKVTFGKTAGGKWLIKAPGYYLAVGA